MGREPHAAVRREHGAALPDGGFDVWAVGDLGTVLHLEGAAWVPVASGTDAGLQAVFAEATRTWAVGAGGLVLVREGASWSRVRTPVGEALHGVWAQPDGGGVWLAGEGNAVVAKVPAR